MEEEEREVGAVEVELVERMRRGIWAVVVVVEWVGWRRVVIVGVGGEMEARGRVLVGVGVVIFAPERRRGRQGGVVEGVWLGGGDVVSVEVRGRKGESLITRASLWADGEVSLTVGKRLYFFACRSGFFSSSGRGESGVR